MGLRDWVSGQFIDIIEWTEPSQNEILAHRFTRHKNEIKNGAKLIVREGQAAVFVKEGQLADVKLPGMYTLDTNNMPILSTILGWKYGFESPFKCEVYFISTRQWTNQKWGTQNPIMFRDPEFGPVRLRAFGNYAFKVTDPGTFLKELVATDPSFELYEISAQFRNVIVSRFIDALGSSKIPMLDLAGNYEKVSKVALERIAPEMAKMGVSLTQFFVENISLPPEVEAALDKRSQMSRARQPRPVHEVPDGGGDPDRGGQPRRSRGPGREPRGRCGRGEPDGRCVRRRGGNIGCRHPREHHSARRERRGRPAAAADRGGFPRRHQWYVGRSVRHGRAGGACEERERHARDAGVEERDGRLGRGRDGAGTRVAVRACPTAATGCVT